MAEKPSEKIAKEVQRKEEIKKKFHLKSGKRKIIQISTYYNSSVRRSFIVALCGDGTLWEYDPKENEWEQIENVPQP